MQQTTTIVGNALAGIVAAIELAKKGQTVNLINPAGPWGGYFGGINIEGDLYDCGMVMLEFSAYMPQSGIENLGSYEPAIRNDIGRFLQLVHDWVSVYTDAVEVAMPQMVVDGQYYDDVLLSNAFEAFKDLPFAEAAISELKQLQPSELHAKHKSQGDAFQRLNYAQASIANHGEVMHNKLIAPYLEKVLGIEADKMLARYHRIPWLPLYYPETLLTCFDGRFNQDLPPTVFHYPQMGSVAALCKAIIEKAKQYPNIRFVSQAINTLRYQNNQWNVECAESGYASDKLVWTHQPTHLLKLLNLPNAPVTESKAKLALIFISVDIDDLDYAHSVINFIDKDVCIYRLTNQTHCAKRQDKTIKLVAEINLDFYNKLYGETTDDHQIKQTILNELISLNILKNRCSPISLEMRKVPGGFLIPDAASRDAWEADYQTIREHYPQIGLLAMTSGYFVTSFNDQIIQGLKFGLLEKD